MEKKLRELVGSVRFWFITIGAIVAIFAFYGVIPPEVVGIIEKWLIAVVGIGTLDKTVSTFAGVAKKK